MLKFTTRQIRNARGFTLVELLVVVIVIAILAGIALVVYGGVQDRSRASIMEADLTNAKKRLTIYEARNGKAPVSMQQMIDANMHFSKSVYEVNRPGKGNLYYCLNNATGKYAIGARTVNAAYGAVIASNGSMSVVSGDTITANYVCSIVGLPSSTDPNAYTFQGLETGTTNWRPWVQ